MIEFIIFTILAGLSGGAAIINERHARPIREAHKEKEASK